MKIPRAKSPVNERRLASAITTLLDYLWDDERSAYRAVSPRERRRHIFRSLRVIRQWLDERDR